ncbi:hypothetical protein CDL15_Pgr013225 [Punica granatum]|uniref:Uncharacterized protein n=1 Tax=Punica granatum TaxID=22663 RepID=A0A218WQ20_PUNGR|nr:hypothetical protein CDL15_Pgr013225 [Punica granatum]
MIGNKAHKPSDAAPAPSKAAATPSSRGGGRKVFEVTQITSDDFIKAVTDGRISDAEKPHFPRPNEKPDQARENEMVIWLNQIAVGLCFPLHEDVVDMCKTLLDHPKPAFFQRMEDLVLLLHSLQDPGAKLFTQSVLPLLQDTTNADWRKKWFFVQLRKRWRPKKSWVCCNMNEEDRAPHLTSILETSTATAIEGDVAPLRDDSSQKTCPLKIKTLVTEEALNAAELIVQWEWVVYLPSNTYCDASRQALDFHLDPYIYPQPNSCLGPSKAPKHESEAFGVPSKKKKSNRAPTFAIIIRGNILPLSNQREEEDVPSMRKDDKMKTPIIDHLANEEAAEDASRAQISIPP